MPGSVKGDIASSFSGSSSETNREPDTSKSACGRPTKDQGKAREYPEEQRIKPEEYI